MRLSVISLMLCTALLTGCGADKPADSREQQPLQQPQSTANAPVPLASNSQATAAPAKSKANSTDAPVPPRDAQFTIVCTAITGPGHVQRAKELKDQLIKVTPFKQWYVTHDEEKSTLFYGYYASVDDGKLKADRQRIAMMQDQLGNRPFAEALPVAIASPDPLAPAEFNLANAKGYWSLQIAAYQGPGRKEAAVEAVKDARKMGVEAYYHHGPNVSEICVGAWPEQAIRKQETDGAEGVDPGDQQRPILLLGPGSEMIPQSVKDQYARNLIDKDSGRPIQVLEQKVEVVDPDMRATMEKYPHHVLNGLEEVTQVRDPKTQQMVNVYKPSMIVPIPHANPVFTRDDSAPAPSLLSPTVPSQPPTGGRLRSVGP